MVRSTGHLPRDGKGDWDYDDVEVALAEIPPFKSLQSGSIKVAVFEVPINHNAFYSAIAVNKKPQLTGQIVMVELLRVFPAGGNVKSHGITFRVA